MDYSNTLIFSMHLILFESKRSIAKQDRHVNNQAQSSMKRHKAQKFLFIENLFLMAITGQVILSRCCRCITPSGLDKTFIIRGGGGGGGGKAPSILSKKYLFQELENRSKGNFCLRSFCHSIFELFCFLYTNRI